MELCTIVLERDVAVDARKYGKILAPILGLTELEAKMTIRRGRGIFLEDLPEDDAKRIAGTLVGDGIPARCVRNEELPVLPVARKVTQLERAEGALRFHWPGEPQAAELPWARIDVVSVGAVARPGFQEFFTNVRFEFLPPLHRMEGDADVRDLLRENVILRMNAPAAREPRRPGKRGDSPFDALQSKYGDKMKVYADLLDDAHTAWLRVPMDEISWAHDARSVKLGDVWGFALFHHELASRCAAAFTERSLQLSSGADIKEVVFLQTEEFTRYTAWHAVLHHLGVNPWPSAGSSSPSPEPPEPSTDGGSSKSSPEPAPPSTSP